MEGGESRPAAAVTGSSNRSNQLEYLIRQYGADHVLLGTSYPYDMGESDPVGDVDSVPGLSDAERHTICYDNATRLLKLDA